MVRLRQAYTLVLALALALVFQVDAIAQRYPSKAIRLMVGDLSALEIGRLVGARLKTAFGQPVEVETSLAGYGMPLLARAAPDGYTILLTTLAAPGAASEPSRDFTLITQATEQHVFLAPAGLPAPVLAALYTEIVKALNDPMVEMYIVGGLKHKVVVTPLRQLARGAETTSGAAEASRAQAGSLFHEAFELFRQGKLNDAERAFEKGLVSDPKNAIAHFYLAEIYDRQGVSILAESHYRQVIKLAPNSEEAATARSRMEPARQ